MAPLLLALLLLGSCTSTRAAGPVATLAPSLPHGKLTLSRAGHRQLQLDVAIAETEPARDAGLMGVRSLGANQGMAFLFPAATTVNFWMKDTLIPLDIAFWDATGTVISTDTMVPCHADPCPQYGAARPYVGAVEVASGLLARQGITVGYGVRVTR